MDSLEKELGDNKIYIKENLKQIETYKNDLEIITSELENKKQKLGNM